MLSRRATGLWSRAYRNSSIFSHSRTVLAAAQKKPWLAYSRFNSNQSSPPAASSSSPSSSSSPAPSSSSSPCPDMIKSYTLVVEGTVVDEKTKNLCAADVWKVFGAFEPYNITLIPPPQDPKKYFACKKGQRPIKTFPLATFQVCSPDRVDVYTSWDGQLPSLAWSQESILIIIHVSV